MVFSPFRLAGKEMKKTKAAVVGWVESNPWELERVIDGRGKEEKVKRVRRFLYGEFFWRFWKRVSVLIHFFFSLR